jgi:hypothetical protein
VLDLSVLQRVFEAAGAGRNHGKRDPATSNQPLGLQGKR